VVGCTICSRGEVPGERKPVIRDDDDDNDDYISIVIVTFGLKT
jgi:hypothetical protein